MGENSEFHIFYFASQTKFKLRKVEFNLGFLKLFFYLKLSHLKTYMQFVIRAKLCSNKQKICQVTIC